MYMYYMLNVAAIFVAVNEIRSYGPILLLIIANYLPLIANYLYSVSKALDLYYYFWYN